MQSREFALIIILLILLKAFSILIGFLKKIAGQNTLKVQINKTFLISCFCLFFSCSYLYHIWLFARLIHLSGDTEKNPKKDFFQTFSIDYCDLNSLVAHNFTKVALLKAHLSVQRFDIFCLYETYLNSSITEDDDSLSKPGYDLTRSGHPSSNKTGVATIYYLWN